jgi:hypothetical protein
MMMNSAPRLQRLNDDEQCSSLLVQQVRRAPLANSRKRSRCRSVSGPCRPRQGDALERQDGGRRRGNLNSNPSRTGGNDSLA